MCQDCSQSGKTRIVRRSDLSYSTDSLHFEAGVGITISEVEAADIRTVTITNALSVLNTNSIALTLSGSSILSADITVRTGEFDIDEDGLGLSDIVTAATNTKISYDAKGRVTAGTILINTDIPKTLDNTWITDFDTQVRTSRLDQMASPTSSVSWNSQKITNLLDPVSNQDAATKAYVDGVALSISPKDLPVRVVYTTNISLTTPGTGTDGITLSNGDRILLTGQSTGSQNGAYLWSGASSTLVRTTDADIDSEVVKGIYFFVTEGTTYGGTGWVLTTNNPIVVGTTSLTFTLFTRVEVVTAGLGLTKTANTIDVITASSSRIVVAANSIDLATTGVTASTYNSVTVDVYGRITAAFNVTIPTVTGADGYLTKISSGNLVISNVYETGLQLGVGTLIPTATIHLKAAIPSISFEDSDAAVSASNPVWRIRSSNTAGNFIFQTSPDSSVFTDVINFSTIGIPTFTGLGGTGSQVALISSTGLFSRGTFSGDFTVNDTLIATITNDAVTFAKMQNASATGMCVVGRSANSAGDFAEITAGTDGHVLRRNGTTIGFGVVPGITGTTGYIPVFTGTNSIGNSIIQQNSDQLGINGAPGGGVVLSIYGLTNTIGINIDSSLFSTGGAALEIETPASASTGILVKVKSTGDNLFRVRGNGEISFGDSSLTNKLGFNGVTPIVRPNVIIGGSYEANDTAILTALQNLGLLTFSV